MSDISLQQAFDLAVRRYAEGRVREAEKMFALIVARHPGHAESLANLGVIALQTGRTDAAVELFRRSIAGNPNAARSHRNLGIALATLGRPDEAIAAYRQCLALEPGHAGAWSSLGNALHEAGRLSEAVAACRKAIALDPDLAEAHYNLAFSLLAQGNMEEGWRRLESRWERGEYPAPGRKFPQPAWDGRGREGLTILLHAEQGFGDTIQFVRYAPIVERTGSKVIIGCQPALERLLRAMDPGRRVVVWEHELGLVGFEQQCPLMSLPRIFGTTLKTIPWEGAYLRATEADAAKWQARVSATGPARLKVGLVWAGSPKHGNDRNRSMKLTDLAPLAHVDGVRVFSLQKGEAAIQAKGTAAPELIDWTEELNDFADTAGLIANLDLIISVDTSVAHLAGAMGKPVWLLLPFVAEWRWMVGRDDSPWYPTMRLFRQSAAGDWEGVARRASERLTLQL
jgi:Tfp pilus assembly protein PilF